MADKGKIILPNIWGEGVLFAFSALDGKTDINTELVATTLPDNPGFQIRFPNEAMFFPRFIIDKIPFKNFPADAVFSLVCGDATDMTIDVGVGRKVRLRYCTVNNATIAGKISCESFTGSFAVELILEPQRNELVTGFIDGGNGNRREFDKPFEAVFAISTGAIPDFDFEAEFTKRLDFFGQLRTPKKCDEKIQRTLMKCFSVLKTNLQSAQGSIKHDWSTPDRYPHRCMWLWDSAFDAIGIKYLSRKKSEDAIRAVLSKQDEKGFVPHMMTPSGDDSKITQPPLLCWIAWHLFDSGSGIPFIESIFPKLVKYHKRYLLMDKNENGLLEWNEGGQESGMDNSPRFDFESKADAIDLNSFIASELFYLGKIASYLHESDTVEYCRKKRDTLAKRINSLLWNEDDGIYYDLGADGKHIKVKTVACFTPLFAGIVPEKKVERLVAHLTNPDEFNRAFPVSNVAGTEASFSSDMWRGPVWANYNYLIIEGLKRYNLNKQADYIAKRTIDEIASWYEKDGAIFEYYDSEAKISPRELPRKGKIGGDWIHTCVKDYSWTAAVFVELVLNS